MHCPVFQLLRTPLCHAQVLQRGLLANQVDTFGGTLSLERLLVETQTVIGLCSFKKGSHPSPPQVYSQSPPPTSLNGLSCPTTLQPHPAKCSHAGGSQVWDFQSAISWGGFCPGIRWADVGLWLSYLHVLPKEWMTSTFLYSLSLYHSEFSMDIETTSITLGKII